VKKLIQLTTKGGVEIIDGDNYVYLSEKDLNYIESLYWQKVSEERSKRYAAARQARPCERP
jgi:hypothetical protein